MTATSTRNSSRTTRSARRGRTERQQMTAEQARTFTYESEASINQVQMAMDARAAEGIHSDCFCEPYTDTYTFNRWKAQGMSVKAGEKAMRIATFAETDKSRERAAEATEGQEYKPKLRPVTTFIFCRCQVAPATDRR